MLPIPALVATVAMAAALLAVPVPGLAQQDEHAHAAVTDESDDEDWHGHPNHLLGFVGSTFDAEEGAFTLGFDYTRQVSQRVSVGGFVDYALGPLRELVVGPMAVFFPWKGLYLEVAPAVEREESEWHFLQRFATGYELEYGSLLVGPYAAIDVAHGKKPLYVAGLTVGVHF